MIKEDLWCGFCGTQEFIEHEDPEHSDDHRYSIWECYKCGAGYELNDGYGYYTVESFQGDPHYADRENAGSGFGQYCLGTGELMDDAKLPRTPEGIVRHSGSGKELEAYLARTQIK